VILWRLGGSNSIITEYWCKTWKTRTTGLTWALAGTINSNLDGKESLLISMFLFKLLQLKARDTSQCFGNLPNK